MPCTIQHIVDKLQSAGDVLKINTDIVQKWAWKTLQMDPVLAHRQACTQTHGGGVGSRGGFYHSGFVPQVWNLTKIPFFPVPPLFWLCFFPQKNALRRKRGNCCPIAFQLLTLDANSPEAHYALEMCTCIAN